MDPRRESRRARSRWRPPWPTNSFPPNRGKGLLPIHLTARMRERVEQAVIIRATGHPPRPLSPASSASQTRNLGRVVPCVMPMTNEDAPSSHPAPGTTTGWFCAKPGALHDPRRALHRGKLCPAMGLSAASMKASSSWSINAPGRRMGRAPHRRSGLPHVGIPSARGPGTLTERARGELRPAYKHPPRDPIAPSLTRHQFFFSLAPAIKRPTRSALWVSQMAQLLALPYFRARTQREQCLG